jgi:hypothetical protein
MAAGKDEAIAREEPFATASSVLIG